MPHTAGKFGILLLLGAAVLCAPARRAAAQAVPYVTGKDLEVAVRAFGFVYGMPKGELNVGIVYDPGSAASAGEANQLQGVIGGGSFAGRKLRARLVPLSQINTLRGGVAYVTHGLQEKLGALRDVAKGNKVLTFSTDFSCVESQKCVMGMTADPAIKIEISRSAAADAGLEFSQALKLMIQEVE